MAEYLTAEDLRLAIKQLTESAGPHPCEAYRFPIVFHPRDAWKVWYLGERWQALKMWQRTWRMLTWREWWGDRPWPRRGESW